jgi:hypothetical protein
MLMPALIKCIYSVEMQLDILAAELFFVVRILTTQKGYSQYLETWPDSHPANGGGNQSVPKVVYCMRRIPERLRNFPDRTSPKPINSNRPVAFSLAHFCSVGLRHPESTLPPTTKVGYPPPAALLHDLVAASPRSSNSVWHLLLLADFSLPIIG